MTQFLNHCFMSTDLSLSAMARRDAGAPSSLDHMSAFPAPSRHVWHGTLPEN
jgi:hypothetical protein